MITFLKVSPDALKRIWQRIRSEQMEKEGKSKTYQMPVDTLKFINPQRRSVVPQ